MEAAGCDVQIMPFSPTAIDRPCFVKSRTAWSLHGNLPGGARKARPNLVLELRGGDL
jgi:hypothetical protein